MKEKRKRVQRNNIREKKSEVRRNEKLKVMWNGRDGE